MNDMQHERESTHASGHDDDVIVLPRPTPWPLVLSVGITLVAAGYVTDGALSVVGGVLMIAALVGWVAALLPGRDEEEHPWAPAHLRPAPIAPAAAPVEPLPAGFMRRMQVPEQIHPYSAGVRGGIVGGIAMAVTALAYGVTSGRGIWYPVNLLAAMLMPSFSTADGAVLEQFNGTALVLGLAIHGVISAGVGLFYGVLLPTLPRFPVLWGGLVAPLLWTGASYGFMGVLNPVMNRRVDWPWFVASQIVYGVTVGLVIVRSKKVPTGRGGKR